MHIAQDPIKRLAFYEEQLFTKLFIYLFIHLFEYSLQQICRRCVVYEGMNFVAIDETPFNQDEIEEK